MIIYRIDKEKCTGCMVCLRSCSVNAISGEKQKPHEINIEKCIKCGSCFEVCRFNAVIIE